MYVIFFSANCCLCMRLMCMENVLNFLYHNSGQLRVFCSVSCTNVFILSTRRIVTCNHCKVGCQNFNLLHMINPDNENLFQHIANCSHFNYTFYVSF